VVGFVGNTGDAFTTSPHLHFEVHPRPLLHLGYDGAVDPTRYLDHWNHLAHARAPAPAHPPLPSAPELKQEARYVFRQLLAARHLIRHPPKPSERPQVKIPTGANGPALAVPPVAGSATAAAAAGSRSGTNRTVERLVLAAMLAAAVATSAAVLRRRGRRREQAEAAESTAEDG
jgi:hypothetical protein